MGRRSRSSGCWRRCTCRRLPKGVETTLKHLFKPETITEQYPEEKPDLPLNYRGVHRLNRDDQGRVKCVACFLCATACPARCIEIVGDKAPWPDRDKYPTKFVIDELKCIYCGMCEEACPVDAIELTSIYDLVGHSRQEMLFDREKLLSVYDQTVKSGKDPIRTHSTPLGPGVPNRHHAVSRRRKRLGRCILSARWARRANPITRITSAPPESALPMNAIFEWMIENRGLLVPPVFGFVALYLLLPREYGFWRPVGIAFGVVALGVLGFLFGPAAAPLHGALFYLLRAWRSWRLPPR